MLRSGEKSSRTRSLRSSTAQLLAGSQDAGGQDLGDLVEALVGGHEIGLETEKRSWC